LSGFIPSGNASYLPTLDFVGMYPTWPTTTSDHQEVTTLLADHPEASVALGVLLG